MTTRLTLVRHGESRATVERRIGGPRTCAGLSALGRRQAERLAERLAAGTELTADVLISSHYQRAIETAELIAPALAIADVVIEPGFGEHDPGPDCDGMAFAEFVDRFGTPDWESDPHAVTFPGGETVADFHHRVGAALSATLREYAGCSIVVACHGGVVDTVFRSLLHLPGTGGFELHTLNTSLTEFVATDPGRWRLVRYNDHAHLAGLPRETDRRGLQV